MGWEALRSWWWLLARQDKVKTRSRQGQDKVKTRSREGQVLPGLIASLEYFQVVITSLVA